MLNRFVRVCLGVALGAVICAPAPAAVRPGGGGAEAETGSSHFGRQLYEEIGLAPFLDFESFQHALVGLLNLRETGAVDNDSVLTIIDYRKPSTKKRLFVADLDSRRLLYRTLVAHGRNSGGNRAVKFSNVRESRQSSLGFFVTSKTYYGRHGYSLKIKGMEPGYNDNAEARSIVIHGADYVSPAFIERHGRLGRSWGCPALPRRLARKIIDTIKGGTCIFVLGPVSDYVKTSPLLDRSSVEVLLSAGFSESETTPRSLVGSAGGDH